MSPARAARLAVASALLVATLAGALAGQAAPQGADPARDKALGELLAKAFGAEPYQGLAGRELFEAALGRPAFRHAEVGPFDVYVYEAGHFAGAPESQGALASATAGLRKAADLLGRLFPAEAASGKPAAGPPRLVTGRRFPIILTASSSATEGDAYAQVVALLDHCEDGGLSGWKPPNLVWCDANLQAEVTRTWGAQVFDVSHDVIAKNRAAWFEHGIGYYALAHVANLLLRQGSWGNVPPWVAQGLVDELDIEAYGEAWVGGDWWVSQTPGWSRPGWSGFLPEGASPPPPVTGPPADLAVVVKKDGHPWEQRESSRERHWSELAADRKSEAPASFAFMAQNESFFPRDRAYARCVMNLALDTAAPDGGGLLEQLDRASRTRRSGMPDSEPLPRIFARALGGLDDIDELEAQSLQDMLDSIGHVEIAERIRALGGEPMLQLPDHRAQAQWLYAQHDVTAESRDALFKLILTAEYYQQLREWELIGRHLDGAANAALAACAHFPTTSTDRAKVAQAFRKGLEVEEEPVKPPRAGSH